MSKIKHVGKSVTATPSMDVLAASGSVAVVIPPTVAEAPKAPKVVQVIAVVPEAKKTWKDGQSGDAWLAAVQACDGKTVAEFVAYCTANPPRLTKSGKLDAPSGWLRFLRKEGLVVLTERPVAAQ